MADTDSAPFVMYRSSTAIAIPILSILTLVLAIPPFVAHIRGRNLAATALVFWIAIQNLFNFINALIWPTDDIPSWFSGAGLCDIEVKISIAAAVGSPGAVASIFRQLAIILNTDRTALTPTKSQQRRRLAIELFLCFGFPVWIMVAQFIVQPIRFYVFAISGCTSAYDESWLAIPLVFIWPLVISLVAAFYCGLVVYRLVKYRRQFGEILSNASSNTNKNRFTRLFILATLFILIFLPLSAYGLSQNLAFEFYGYSWSQDHGSQFNQVIQVPSEGHVLFDRWIQIANGFAVFLLFGFGKDAMAMYKSWIVKCGLERILPKPKTPSHTFGSSEATMRGSRLGSVGSRARLVFQKKRSPDSTWLSRSTRNDSVTLNGDLSPTHDPNNLNLSGDSPLTPESDKSTHSKATADTDPRPAWTRWIPLGSRNKHSSAAAADVEKGTTKTRIWSDKQGKAPAVDDGHVEVKSEVVQSAEKV
ncbi:MAG: hypothetical protein Q9227_008393 [Pyrenula ochraceoflavens]